VRILTVLGIFLAGAWALAETAYYRVEFLPSGSLVAIGAPVVRGATLLVHGYPDGRLMSLRKSDVRSVTPITAQEAAAPAQKSVIAIGNLAMQGGAETPGTARSSAARSPGRGPRIVATPDGLAVTTSAPAPAAPSAQSAPSPKK
jgi:hypothetical protein